ncbi:hypothetical protein [Constantimarinum furrinae]|uniref:hypothetical protein n=1 Tax=Constantimarinum furrinae TaxID=2562285 RepID=UPI00164B6FF4|nr:hypothetical protein [Constantimarinum furrinae]
MKTYLLTFAVIISSVALAQVGIGTTTPNALLDIQAGNTSAPLNTDGILIPRVSNFPATNPTSAQNGMLIFLDTQVGINSPNFYYWDHPNGQWEEIGNTLDEAYDQDGPGNGKIITADSGGVLIQGTDGLQVTGTHGSGATLPLSGAGTKMFFYPRKSAFRAGGVSGSQWDDGNIGNYSTAFGYNTIASGSYSFASGYESVASGENSVALSSATASGLNAVAIGYNAIASADNAVAIGGEATVPNAIAIGATVTGVNSVGILGNATVDNSVAIMSGSAQANNSFAYLGDAMASNSMSLGGTAEGEYSIAFIGATANSYGEIALGSFGVDYAPASTTNFVETDRLFSLANGYRNFPSSTVYSNAMIILKNGNVGLSIDDPQLNLQIDGGLAFEPDSTISVTTDNQLITVGNTSCILLTSNGTDPTTRTIILTDGLATGQMLIIAITGNSFRGVELIDNTTNVNLQQTRQLYGGDTLSLLWNGAQWLETNYSDN